MSLSDEVREAEELSELRKTNASLAKRLKVSNAKTQDMIDAVYRAAYEASLIIGNGTPIPSPKLSAGKAEVALVHATDWQYGKGTESYSQAVCEKRIMKFVQKVEELTNIQRADHPVNECHLMLGGDMVEGMNIFPGQVYEIESYLFEQLFGVSALIEQMVSKLLETFPKVVVWEESGNHGRLGRKGENPGGDNIDRMAYKIAKERMESTGSKGLTWNSQTSWYQIVEIGNYKCMLAHGDEIKSFGGNTPAFGILRKCNQWATGVLEEHSDVYLGHFHTPMTLTLANGARVFITGSPESDNQYAKEFMAATGHPSQRIHFIDPRKGRVTSEHLVWLE